MARPGAKIWRARLDAWLAPFWRRRRASSSGIGAPLYMQGLLLPSERKSVEPMAAQAALLHGSEDWRCWLGDVGGGSLF